MILEASGNLNDDLRHLFWALALFRKFSVVSPCRILVFDNTFFGGAFLSKRKEQQIIYSKNGIVTFLKTQQCVMTQSGKFGVLKSFLQPNKLIINKKTVISTQIMMHINIRQNFSVNNWQFVL